MVDQVRPRVVAASMDCAEPVQSYYGRIVLGLQPCN